MADKKISQLTAATTPLAGTEVLPIVQNSATVKVSVNNLFENASSTKTGVLSSTDWSTFNNKAPAFTYTSGYIPFGQGTTTPNQSSSLYWDNGNHRLGIGTTSPRNGIDCNTAIYSNQFLAITRPADNGIATGPCVVMADSNTSHQWIVQMGASDQLFSWLYNGSSWLNPFTISATSQLNLTGTGQGIQFGSSSVLNDYEEGTWTPSITVNSGTATGYSNVYGYYRKVGSQVTVWGSFIPTGGTFGDGTNYCKVSGLPYTASSSTGAYGVGAIRNANNVLPTESGTCVIQATTADVYTNGVTISVGNACGFTVTYFV